jgi:hypothetical protein
VIGNDQLAREHALDHEQTDVAAARSSEAGHVPGTHAEAMGPYDERALGLRATVLGQQRAEVGIGVQEPNRLVPGGAPCRAVAAYGCGRNE